MASITKTFSVGTGIQVANTIVIDSSLNISNITSLNVTTVNANTFSTGAGSPVPGTDLFTLANTANNTGVNAYVRANLAYTAANSAQTAANTANTNALNAYGQANLAYTAANSAQTYANSLSTSVNSTFATINTNYQAAYSVANSALSAGGGTITGNLTISGNLFVEGDRTTFNVASLSIEDNEIILNSNQATPSLDAIITAERGSGTDTYLKWNETTDKWTWSDDGSTAYNFSSALNAYGQANLAYTAANSAQTSANTVYAQANLAYTAANSAQTYGNTLSTSVNTTVATINTNYQAAYAQANAAYGAANNSSNTISGTLKAVKEFIVSNTTTTTANTVDLSISNYYKHTLTGNTTFTFSNAPSANAQLVTLLIIQDATGSRTVTWANTVYWAGGTIPPATTTANARDMWTFITYDAGSTFWGTLAMKDVR